MSGETSIEQQRPDLGIETVMPAASVTVTDEQFPWLSASTLDVPTVGVQLAGLDEVVRYLKASA